MISVVFFAGVMAFSSVPICSSIVLAVFLCGFYALCFVVVFVCAVVYVDVQVFSLFKSDFCCVSDVC